MTEQGERKWITLTSRAGGRGNAGRQGRKWRRRQGIPVEGRCHIPSVTKRTQFKGILGLKTFKTIVFNPSNRCRSLQRPSALLVSMVTPGIFVANSVAIVTSPIAMVSPRWRWEQTLEEWKKSRHLNKEDFKLVLQEVKSESSEFLYNNNNKCLCDGFFSKIIFYEITNQ